MFFVQRLRQRQRCSRGESEAAVRLALQAGQVVEQRCGLRRRLGLLGNDAGFAFALGDDLVRGVFDPKSLRARVRIIIVLLEFFVEPPAAVFAARGAKCTEYLPVPARLERANFGFAIDKDRERRRLHASHGSELKPTGPGIECGHRARSIDPDQPVRFGPAHRRIRQREHRLVTAQFDEAIADGGRGHRLQPKTLDGLAGTRILGDVTENELAFAAGVAGVDKRGHVLALDELEQRFQSRLGLLDRLERELRRDRRQMCEGPFAALDLFLFRHADLEQVAHSRRKHVLVAFENIVVTGKASQRARNVGGDGGLLGDDQTFGHGAVRVSRVKGRADNKQALPVGQGALAQRSA